MPSHCQRDEKIEITTVCYKYTKRDIKNAYHQYQSKTKKNHVLLFEDCGRSCQFCQIPFGFTNGISCFQRAADCITSVEKPEDTFVRTNRIDICGETSNGLRRS